MRENPTDKRGPKKKKTHTNPSPISESFRQRQPSSPLLQSQGRFCEPFLWQKTTKKIVTNCSVSREAKNSQPMRCSDLLRGTKYPLSCGSRVAFFYHVFFFKVATPRRTSHASTRDHLPRRFLPRRYCWESWKPHFWEREPSLVDCKRWRFGELRIPNGHQHWTDFRARSRYLISDQYSIWVSSKKCTRKFTQKALDVILGWKSKTQSKDFISWISSSFIFFKTWSETTILHKFQTCTLRKPPLFRPMNFQQKWIATPKKKKTFSVSQTSLDVANGAAAVWLRWLMRRFFFDRWADGKIRTFHGFLSLDLQ